MNGESAGNKGNSKMLTLLGSIVLILGIIGLFVMSFVATAIISIVGILLLVGGIIIIIYGFTADARRYGIWPTIIGGVALGIGIILALFPLLVAAIITLFLGIFFVIAALVAFAAVYRDEHGKAGHLLIGVGNLILALLVFLNWPGNSDTVLGFFISIDLILGGIWLLILANALKNVTEGESRV